MDHKELEGLLKRQDRVVSRRQLLELGAQRHDVQRLLRRKELALAHDGVYVNHTGEPTRRQRAWAAVLFAAPAALCLGSALAEEHDPVHVAIDTSRRVRPPDGVRVHRVTGLRQRVRWRASHRGCESRTPRSSRSTAPRPRPTWSGCWRTR